MSDDLAPYPPDKVAKWYGRLAAVIAAKKINGEEPLASRLLQAWLDFGGDGARVHQLVIRNPPKHLRENSDVLDVLRFHRAVYLTQQKGRFTGGSERWVGILPRLQGKPGFTKWDIKDELDMNYQSLCDISITKQLTGDDGEKDLLYALHDFQVKSQVTVTATAIPGGKLRITFKKFEAQALDTYDWDPTKHITVPNPDYGSKDPDAIKPGSQTIDVHHSNAKRVEAAGLAAPYDLNTVFWPVADAGITGSAIIDPKESK